MADFSAGILSDHTYQRRMKFIRQIIESFLFAWQALRSNLLRTTLSLLGVSVGIFAMVAVFTLVDSLERNVRQSMNAFGGNVLYIQKWPWLFEPDFPWWKYFQWPYPKYSEYKFLYDNLETAAVVAIVDFRGNVTVKNGSNSMQVQIQGSSFEYNQITEIEIENGRYFSQQEVAGARDIAIIGAEIAETLFPETDPLGKDFKLSGRKFRVVGVQKKKGKTLVDFGGDADKKCIIPYGTFAKMFQSRWADPDIVVKGFDRDEGLVELEAEVTGLMRAKRGLRPTDDTNFSINRPEALSKAVGGVFGVLTVAGGIISLFSMLIGGFGIANIMFVSVKERTNLIGIQKSLGAKNYFILSQFLFEAVILSLIGGLVGVVLVYLFSFVPVGTLEIVLTPGNILLGLGVSTAIGVISGIVPALMASRLDPVIAIRAK